MASADVSSKAESTVFLFVICCCYQSLYGLSVRSLFCYSVLCVLSNLAIISLEKGELIALNSNVLM